MNADLTASYDRSSNESNKFSSDIAKDITQKAVKNVAQKVTQSQTTKIIETFEELESQSFDNKKGANHISGVYQWVEKVYLAQVFNYGRHEIFDIMVPEPAAALIAMATSTSNLNKPIPPDSLGTIKHNSDGTPMLDANGNKQLDIPLNPLYLSESSNSGFYYYGNWVAKYMATGVEPPPRESITCVKTFSADVRNAHLNDTIKIDDGYAAVSFTTNAAWRCAHNDQENFQVDILVGQTTVSYGRSCISPNMVQTTEQNYTGFVRNVSLTGNLTGIPQPLEQREIAVVIDSSFLEELSVNIEITCKRTEQMFTQWKLKTYEKIVMAFQKLQSDYESKMASMQFQKGSIGPLGAADPEANRQIERTELKRSCIALLANDYSKVDGFDALRPWLLDSQTQMLDPDLTLSMKYGSWVRWFEQVFEWDKIGYVFYPYYWGRASEWVKRLNLKNDDPLFLNFLQAGYARVVVPVRNGFENAVNFFLLTGLPWMGGNLPSIGDKTQNPLYLDIVEEMKGQSGASGKELPFGDPWEIRIPTTLIKLRKDDLRPEWKRKTGPTDEPAGPWDWEEDAIAWDDK